MKRVEEYKIFLLLVILFTIISCTTEKKVPEQITQPEIVISNYPFIDAHALGTPEEAEKSLESLVSYLIAPARNDEEKVRAIFRWITDRIVYDVDSYFSGTYTNASPEEILKERKAVCQNYAVFFNHLGKLAGLEIVNIKGYAKGYRHFYGQKKFTDTNHLWNAVRINKKWYLVDSAWGAGYVNGREYKKKFDEFYFFTPPEQFIFEHLPASPEWQLIQKPISLHKFEKMPHLRSSFFRYRLSLNNLKMVSERPGFRGIPELFDYIDKRILIHNAPLEMYLQSDTEYFFCIESPDLIGLAVINSGEWHYFDQDRNNVYSKKISVKPGKLQVSAKFPDKGDKFWPILIYIIE